MATKDIVGRLGEELAAQHLVRSGWKILERNWRGGGGEADLIALDGATAVLVEVKTRTSAQYGIPASAVTKPKLAQMHRVLAAWLETQTAQWFEVRLDVISVLLEPGADPDLEHFQAVA